MSIFRGSGVAIITPMHEDGSFFPEKLDEIIEKCMALNPKERYRNASEIAYALRPLGRAKKNHGGKQ